MRSINSLNKVINEGINEYNESKTTPPPKNLGVRDFLSYSKKDLISFDDFNFKYGDQEGEEGIIKFLLENHYTEKCSMNSVQQINSYDRVDYIVVSMDYVIQHRWSSNGRDDFNGYGYVVIDKKDGGVIVSFVDNPYYNNQYDDEKDEFDVIWHKI